MPIVFNEPLSFLQRMTEYMEYARLLRMASEQDDPVERMKYVAGTISIMNYISNICGDFLPFLFFFFLLFPFVVYVT